MSTKLFSRSFSTYGEYIQLQIPYCNGIVLGAVKLNHKFNKDDIVEYGNDIINNLRSLNLPMEVEYIIRSEQEGEYTFLFAEGEEVVDAVDSISTFDDEKWYTKPLCLAIKEGKAFLERQLRNRIAHMRYDQFSSLVEEKNYLQRSIALLADKTFEYLSPSFCCDPFFAAVERAAVYNDDGFVYYLIPTAEDIFEVFDKLLKRWNLDYFEVIGAKKKEGA